MTTKVEDNIDIEDNPRIHSLLSNLCRVKDEIPDLESQDHMTNNESFLDTDQSTDVEHQLQRSESELIGFHVTVDVECIKNESTEKETPNDIEPDNTEHISPDLVNNSSANDDNIHIEDNLSDLSINSNRSEETVYDVNHTEMRKITSSFVKLDEWGPRLQNNPCFCKKCKILFRTNHSFQAHDIVVHKKFVTKLMKKSTLKIGQSAHDVVHEQLTETAEKSSSVENHNTSDAGEVCNHCNVTFPDSETLVSHLYEIWILGESDRVCNSPESMMPENENEQETSSETCSLLDQTENEKAIPNIEQVTDSEIDEDTLPPLLTSIYYCCDICCYYLKVRHGIIAHMASNHAIDTGGFNAEPFNPQCRFCSNSFKCVHTYKKHIKNMHKEKFLEKVTETVDNSLQLIPSHDMTGRYNDTQLLHVAKSVLFQCKRCSIHFTRFTDANLHIKNCPNKKALWRCRICKRFFELEDKKKHMLQHRLSSEAFNVYFVENNTLGRILNKCAECETYLHESTFATHSSTPCKREFEKCTLCELDIHSSSIKQHYKKHKIMSKQNDFIIVEFAKLENCDIERLISEVTEASAGAGPVKVFYCAKCGTCSIGGRRGQHISGTCQNIQRKNLCTTCGIVQSSTLHYKFHKKHPKLTLMDMQVFDVDTQELISPPFPPFPRCTKCNVYLCRKKHDKKHKCKDPYRTCEQCNEKFMDLAYELHIQYHQYAARMASSSSKNTEAAVLPNTPEAVLPSHSITKSVPSQSRKPPKNKKEKISGVQNVLFRCNACDIVHDNYDKTVEHCQKHFSNMESHDIIVKHCKICCLKFDSSCFDVHKRLHAQNKAIKKDSFRIVIYNYNNILRTYWVTSLRLQFEKIEEIIANSIYLYTRKVKLRLVQHGDAESTQFKCCKCEKYVYPKQVFSHCHKKCDKNIPSFACVICKCECSSASTRAQHMTLHKKFDHFKIVSFNEPGDEDFNNKLFANDMRKTFKGVPSMRNKMYYYKCDACQRCLPRLRGYMHRHICSRTPQVRCDKCNLLFARGRGYDHHVRLHQSNPNFNRKHIEITNFLPSCKSETKSSVVLSTKKGDKNNKTNSKTHHVHSIKGTLKLYQCSCNLHFASISNALEHVKVCDPKSDVIKEECSKCKRMFATTELETHLREHHSGNNRTKVNIIPMKTPKEMKRLCHHCKRCDFYFLSQRGLAYHVSSGHEKDTFRACPYCMCKFTRLTLNRHICIHHLNKPEKAKPSSNRNQWTTRIKTVTEKVLKKLDMKYFSKNLYKCTTCNAHFVTYGALYSHLHKSHFKHVEKCDICQYEFNESNMRKHKYVHHERMKLQRKDFVIVTIK